jgi:hypothetical protein
VNVLRGALFVTLGRAGIHEVNVFTVGQRTDITKLKVLMLLDRVKSAKKIIIPSGQELIDISWAHDVT